MHKLAILIQTRLSEKEGALELLRSIDKHNASNLPVYVTVHNGEQDVFASVMPHVTEIVEDHEIFDSLLTNRALQLQSVNLNLHRPKLAENWIVLTSNHRVVKSFATNQFFTESGDLKYYVSDSLDAFTYVNFFGMMNFRIPKYKASDAPRIWATGALRYLDTVLATKHMTTDQMVAFADMHNFPGIDRVVYSSMLEPRLTTIEPEIPNFVEVI